MIGHDKYAYADGAVCEEEEESRGSDMHIWISASFRRESNAEIQVTERHFRGWTYRSNQTPLRKM